MFKVGISLYSFGFLKLPSFNMFLKSCMNIMSSNSIAYCELPIDNSFSIEEAKVIKSLLNQKIECYSVHLPKRNSAKDILQNTELLEGIKYLRPSIIVFHPQSIADFGKDYSLLSQIFNKNGAVLSLELITYDELLRKAFQKIDKTFAITLDLFHCANAGYSLETIIKRLSSSIVHVHLNDYSLSERKSVCPGEGSLPIKQVIDLLKEQKYKGLFMIESNLANKEHLKKVLSLVSSAMG